MTYQKFLDIVYHTSKEKDYYCWTTARPTKPRVADELMYLMYCDRMDRINKFKKEVLTEVLKKLPNNYFD